MNLNWSGNIGKHMATPKYPHQDPKSTKIEHSGRILALWMHLKSMSNHWVRLKNGTLLFLFPPLPLNGLLSTRSHVEMVQHTRKPSWGHKQYHIWSLGTDFSPENGQVVKQRKFVFHASYPMIRHGLDVHSEAKIRPEFSILVLFGFHGMLADI